MEEFGKLEERVVLVGVQTDDHDNVEESLDELKELASTAELLQWEESFRIVSLCIPELILEKER